MGVCLAWADAWAGMENEGRRHSRPKQASRALKTQPPQQLAKQAAEQQTAGDGVAQPPCSPAPARSGDGAAPQTRGSACCGRAYFTRGAGRVDKRTARMLCTPCTAYRQARRDGPHCTARAILWLPPRQAGSMHTTAEGPPPPPQHGHAESLVLLSLAPLLSGGALLGAPRAGQQAECACTGRQGGAGWAAACRWNALRPQPANLQGVRRAQAEGNILP